MLAANNLLLNESKAELILFCSAKQHPHTLSNIKVSNFVLELEIGTDETLSCNKQTENLSKKLSRANSFLSKSIYHAPIQAMVSSGSALFHSYISYGLSVWYFTSNKNK